MAYMPRSIDIEVETVGLDAAIEKAKELCGILDKVCAKIEIINQYAGCREDESSELVWPKASGDYARKCIDQEGEE